MITRVRETEGGYRVTLLTTQGEVDRRETPDLAEAFAWQAFAAAHGALPSLEPEPVPVAAPARTKKKGRAK